MFESLRAQGLFSAIDCHFAQLLGQKFAAGEEEQLLAALLSHSRSQGHSCLDLELLAQLDNQGQYRAILNRLPREQPTPNWQSIGQAGEYKPIIHAQGRYFLHRFWHHEQCIAQHLEQRLALANQDIAPPDLNACLSQFFPASPTTDWQQIATALAVLRPLTIISGGPGTGKTTTVAKILAIIITLAPQPPRVAIAAPTGKAATRLQESLLQARETLACPTIPTDTATIHRLLGVRPRGNGYRHHQDNPLPTDIVIIDEVSMIDVALMAHLLAAIPPTAQLILLGDKDQLASVNPGAVFAELYAAGQINAFGPETTALLNATTGAELPLAKPNSGPLTDSLVELRHSYRYPPHSGLGQLASLIKGGQAKKAVNLLGQSASEDIRLLPLSKIETELPPLICHWYGAYLAEQELPALFTALEQFRVLSATRSGPLGVTNLNQFIAAVLADHGLLVPHDGHYHGQPIMIQRNDYGLQLFNGDIGIIRRQPDGQLAAIFPTGQNDYRLLPPARLPAHETAFAMTIHKSQGSEFNHLALILPATEHAALLSRELFYTGLSRARQQATIFAQPKIITHAIGQQTKRMSGLAEKLKQPAANH